MPHTASYAAYSSSQLIQHLRELSLLDGPVPHSRFVAILGKCIDFSEAMAVSELLSDLGRKPPNTKGEGDIEGEGDVADIKQRYLQSRGEMMAFIIQSFITVNCPVSLKLPLAGDDTFSHDDKGLSAYQRFYTLHQSQMEAGTLKLQVTIRRHLSATSPHLSQLAVLDNKLSAILIVHSRKALGAVPLLLAKRFQILCFEPAKTKSSKSKLSKSKSSKSKSPKSEPSKQGSLAFRPPDILKPKTEAGIETKSGLEVFLAEMQSVLLAELDIRLQPTLGLIEALTLEKEESTK
jgi:hypothetical protein